MQNQDDLVENKPASDHTVAWWEFFVVSIGAILLIGAGVFTIWQKILHNTINPRRSEAVARSIFDYEIPGGSTGVFNYTMGKKKKAAAIVSNTSSPDVELFVMEVGEEEEEERTQLPLKLSSPKSDSIKDRFKESSSRVENKTMCGLTTPVQVQEGELEWKENAPTLPAVRYSAMTSFRGSDRIVQLTTSGEKAKRNAEIVFNSLKCQ